MLTGLCMALSVGLIDFRSYPASFTPAESQAVKTYWTKPDRLTICAMDPADKYHPRVTGDGSEWLLHYYKAAGYGRVLPTRNPEPQSGDQRRWEAWIDKRYDHDLAQAQAECDQMNGQAPAAVPDVPDCPGEITQLAGDPPPFFRPQIPAQYMVKFDDFTAVMNDAVQTRRKYPYFRFPEGVDVLGGSPSWRELSRAFSAAHINPSRARVMMAVASLEGGFASVNTYDSGYVSVGFVQFASLQEGAGSLGEMLLSMKRSDKKSFEKDFRRFGVDVTADKYVVILDPDSGTQFVGPDAAKHIIEDKRLTAIFYRAGQLSTAFHAAQIKGAMDRFYPAGIGLTVSVGGQTVSGRMADVFRSEAGQATLMDRYVNTGNLSAVPPVVAQVMQEHGYKTFAEAAASEAEMISALKYRRDFTSGFALSTPSSLPVASLAMPGSMPSVADQVDALVDKVMATPDPASALPNQPVETAAPVAVEKKPEPVAAKPAEPIKIPPAPVDAKPKIG